MKISDLKAGQGKVDIEAEITELGEPRSFDKFGREIRVANAVVKDDSGSIKLSLWNQDIEKVKLGDRIKIINGFVNEFKGEMQLTSGKFGKLEVLDGSSPVEEENILGSEQGSEDNPEEFL